MQFRTIFILLQCHDSRIYPQAGMEPRRSRARSEVQITNGRPRACESEQHHVVIMVRNKGLSQPDQDNMW